MKMKELSPEARIVNFLQENHNILTIAGAGGGKTHIIVCNVIYLLKNCHVSPEKIVIFTFTDKAADELRMRVYAEIQATKDVNLISNLHQMFIGTIHGFCREILKTHYNLGLHTILDEVAEKAFLQKYTDQLGLSGTPAQLTDRFHIQWKNMSSGYICRKFCESVNIVMEEQLDLKKILDPKTGNPQLDAFLASYEKFLNLLNRNRNLTFSQLMHQAYSNLERDPAPIRSLEYLFVDEFHDVNRIQANLVEKIGHYANIFVVGDPKQTIYNFRGSNPEYLNECSLWNQNIRKMEKIQILKFTSTI
jgi:DNA helicase-2/ATP-dependent DNA helicase PcrA